ncbi:MAG: cohesin domain-containing protein, partial [Patescibacteria group bacterium]
MATTPLRTTLTTVLVALGVALCGHAAAAATLTVTPVHQEYATGETFLVELHLNSDQQVVNAIQATLTYPADLLEVVEVSRGGSFLTLWAKEPAVDSAAGVISFSGGVPGGSYVVDGKVLTVTFRSRAAGDGEVGIDSVRTSVHLNDGLGTALPLELVTGIYRINPTKLIAVNSPTHPNENAWYRTTTFTVQWERKAGAAYSYLLGTNPDVEPDDQRDATTGLVSYPDLADGVYYFVL